MPSTPRPPPSNPLSQLIDDQLKPTTPEKSEEDVFGEVLEQESQKAADKDTADALHATKIHACPNIPKVNGESGDAMEDSPRAVEDMKSTSKRKGEGGGKKLSKEDLSHDDSQDESAVENAIKVEQSFSRTVEGEQPYKLRMPKDINELSPHFFNIYNRMNLLEHELQVLRGNELKSKLKDESATTPLEPAKVISAIQRLTWADFKPTPALSLPVSKATIGSGSESGFEAPKNPSNQYGPFSAAKKKEQHHVLEVLIGYPTINRKRDGYKHTDDNVPEASGRKTRADLDTDATNAVATEISQTKLQYPERLRISSRPLLKILLNIFSVDSWSKWNLSHMTFLRPFKVFVLYEREIREFWRALEEKWQSKEQGPEIKMSSELTSETNVFKGDDADETETEKDGQRAHVLAAQEAEKTDTFEALEHFRLLVHFLDNDLKPMFDMRKRIKAKMACPIAFADLWHLYECGQEVRTSDSKLQVYKVAKFTGGRDLLHHGSGSLLHIRISESCNNAEETNRAFFIECFRYDFDGTHYGPVREIFEIRRYEGLKDITSLIVYPLYFDHGYQKERARLIERGEKFVALTRVKETPHKSYAGISVDEYAEEIESPIIVDFQLAFAKGRIPKPRIGFQSQLHYDPRETNESRDFCGVNSCGRDHILQDQDFDLRESVNFLADQGPHLAPVENAEDLGQAERLLLPYTVHGFVLRNRKWRTFNIDRVEDMVYSRGFDDLVLPNGHKETVEALVNSHSRGVLAAGHKADAKVSMDLVTGKGQGLIILLHGAPGIGKTSTAECVADKTKRPLFPITCGDLGESAIQIEESLERNFFLARRWGCVLLLDEADVFLILRNQTDISRNAVVSVFLRTLEYYSGILFLTTNRVGALDPAFKSRIHVSLYYPKLTKSVSTEIWKNHIRKAKEYFERRGGKYSLRKREILEFSKQNFKDLKRDKAEPWNGRQIRNAFQTAIALAEHEVYIKGGNPELTEMQFEKVAKASSEFDRYLRITHGRSESQLAEAAKLRTDDFDKAENKMAAISQRQRQRIQTELEDESSDSDSSDKDGASSSEEMPPPKASKQSNRKQKVLSEDDAVVAKKSKKEMAKQESTSEDEAPSTKKGKKEKERKKKKKEPSSDDDDQESSEGAKKVKRSAKETDSRCGRTMFEPTRSCIFRR